MSMLILGRECKQDISGQSAVLRIAGIDEHHSASDHRTGAVQRASIGLYPIDGVVRPNRIEFPEDMAVFRAERADVSINGAGEYDARDSSYGLGLCGTAAAP